MIKNYRLTKAIDLVQMTWWHHYRFGNTLPFWWYPFRFDGTHSGLVVPLPFWWYHFCFGDITRWGDVIDVPGRSQGPKGPLEVGT